MRSKKKAMGLNRIKLLLILLSVIVLLPAVSILAFELYYFNKSLPGIRIGTENVGGLSRAEVEQRVNSLLESRRKEPLVIRKDGRVLFALESPGQFFWYDVNGTIEAVMSYGREGSYLGQLRNRLTMLRYGARLTPVYGFDKETLDSALAQKLREFENPVEDASFELDNNQVRVRGSRPGYVANRDSVLSEIDHYWSFIGNDNQFSLTFSEKRPTIADSDLAEYVDDVERLRSRKFILSTNELYGQTFPVEGKELFPFLRISRVGESVNMQFDEYRIAERFKNISEAVKKDPIDAKIQFDGDRASEFEPAQDGVSLDTQSLAKELFRIGTADTSESKVDLPLKRTPPAITTESVNDYGIREIIGTGRSVFTGSAAGRVHNVALASSKLNGVLIAPGEVFSMYKAVGEIEAETGFKDAFIIKNGRTIPGVGGGVCQVSTTLFRAVLNAGLPIVERKAHAYRVSYYEKDSPPGLDAAVYFPSWDLKFKNDTANYILLQTKVDTKRMVAEYNLFGVSDGRVVEMTKPVVSSQTPPPPDLYQDDPTLPKGVTKQVDYAAWGATASFERTVMRNGVVHLQDSFKSAYRPWQAVFLVGTREN